MSMVLIIGSLFLTSNVINMIVQSLKKTGVMMFGINFADLPGLWAFMTSVMPYVITIFIFYMIYKILPKTKIYSRAAWLGAFVAGVLTELTIAGFAYYVKNFGKYDVFYGSVAGIIIIIFCIYLASIILLIGAEITEIANTKLENKEEMEITFKEFEKPGS
jgi:membrane protein